MKILGPKDAEAGNWEQVEWPWERFTAKFGDVKIKPISGDGWRVNTIYVRLGDQPATFVATAPPNTPIAWYWPDAPTNYAAMPTGGLIDGMVPNRAIVESKPENTIGFAMGTGAYYYIDQGQRGPHGNWIAGKNSEVVWGIGMLPGTNHHHFDVEWAYAEEPEPPQPPVAAFDYAPASGVAPLDVQFTDRSQGTVVSWQWTFGDGGTSTAQNPRHTYQAGSWTVALTVANASGSDTKTVPNAVVVESSPPEPDPLKEVMQLLTEAEEKIAQAKAILEAL